MKKIFTIALFGLIMSCSVTNKIDWTNSFWGTLESEEAYLYTSNSLTSIIDMEIKKGSILYFHNKQGDFQEVYTESPEKISKNERQNFKYYLYKPKYQKLTTAYKSNYAFVNKIPFDPEQSYFSGTRGGCYYINKHGNKTYVNRSYCDKVVKSSNSTAKPKTTYKKKSSSGCSSVQCSGRTKKGTRCRNKTTNCSGRCHLH